MSVGPLTELIVALASMQQARYRINYRYVVVCGQLSLLCVCIRCSLIEVTAGSVDGVLLCTVKMFIQDAHTLHNDQTLPILAIHT